MIAVMLACIRAVAFHSWTIFTSSQAMLECIPRVAYFHAAVHERIMDHAFRSSRHSFMISSFILTPLPHPIRSLACPGRAH